MNKNESAYEEVELTTFADEPEAKKFIDRANLNAIGGAVYDVVKVSKVIKKSETTGANYPTYSFVLRDSYDEYVVDNVFRNQMKWKSQTAIPSKIHLNCEKSGKFYNWILTIPN